MVFAEQVALARERALPVSIHVRGEEPDAHAELLDIWLAEGRGDVEGVLHCYTGPLEFARRALDARLDVSFSGILTFKRDRGLRDVARGLPLSRLHVETDAPLLAPEGFRGRRNEPAHVTVVGEVLAAVHEIAAELDATPAQVSLAWVLFHSEITVADVGCDTVDQIDENLGALDLELSPAQIGRLNGE